MSDVAALQVTLLGCTELPAVWHLQSLFAQEISTRRDRAGALILCEHPLAVTIGREGSLSDLRGERSEIQRRGIPVEWVRRGGGTWVHHPGQLLAYLIIPVERLGLSVRTLSECWLESLCALAEELEVKAEVVRQPLGIRGRCGQFAFVGCSIQQGITQFGACLNVAVPRGALMLSRWGSQVRAGCLTAERMRPVLMARVREAWQRHLARVLGYPHAHLFTGHPALQRTHRMHWTFCDPTAGKMTD
ncbi:MAG: hypothetical protein KatS3mg114_0182 [Planctomycetaceae bacterium]|nr:MAG: hypothetical protein KatS3mg114_0182 [Planctomycetaceae bacterium]